MSVWIPLILGVLDPALMLAQDWVGPECGLYIICLQEAAEKDCNHESYWPPELRGRNRVG